MKDIIEQRLRRCAGDPNISKAQRIVMLQAVEVLETYRADAERDAAQIQELRASAQEGQYRDALVAFVQAYEAQDADNFTDAMRDAYATASMLCAHHATRHAVCEVCGETADLTCGPSRFGPDTWACKQCWNPDEALSS